METLDAEAGKFVNINIFYLFADDSTRYLFSFLYVPRVCEIERRSLCEYALADALNWHL